MYLEPDEEEAFGYLEALRNAILKVSDMAVSDSIVENSNKEVKKRMSDLYYYGKKFKRLFDILDKWLYIEQEDKCDFAAFFAKENIKSVAIYGMSSLGKHLLIQLKREQVAVLFGIDRYVGQFGCDYKIYRPEEEFPDVDAIIITAYEVEPILKSLRSKYTGKIWGLEEIIDDMMKRR